MAHVDLAAARFQLGDTAGALAAAEAALARGPTGNEASLAQRALGVYLDASGRPAEAEAALKQAVASAPDNARAHESLADLYRRQDRCAEAVSEYEILLSLDPRVTLPRVRLAMCQVRAGRAGDGRRGLEAAMALFPENRDLTDALARVLAAAPDATVRDGAAALALAEANHARHQALDTLETLAMALAAAGRFPDARARQREAVELAGSQGRAEWRAALADNLRRYEAGQPAAAPWPEFIARR
jgi:tetratricopeptide (TPR) repeat protein